MIKNCVTSRCFMVLLLVFSGFGAATPLAEAQGGLILWSVNIENAEALREARTFRVYESRSELRLRIGITNGSSEVIQVDQGRFVAGVQISGARDGGNKLPFNAEWNTRDSIGWRPVGLGETLLFDPTIGAEWQVVLRPLKGERFTDGRYTIDVSLAGAQGSIRTTVGSQWQGLGLGQTQLFVIIGAPSGAREQAAAYRLAGDRALAENRIEDALRLFQLARKADPIDVLATIALGNTYLRLNRYREAIVELEAALRIVPQEHSPVPSRLALAYLGVGDESNAVQALRRGGMPEDRIGTELQRLRAQIQQRR